MQGGRTLQNHGMPFHESKTGSIFSFGEGEEGLKGGSKGSGINFRLVTASESEVGEAGEIRDWLPPQS